MPEASPPVIGRFHWIARHVPTRESIQQNRLLRPFAKHLGNPALWRLHRRSVPRAVALGLFVGVIIPFMHTVVAAILAIPTRANVLVAALFTLVVNPLTIPFMYMAAYRIGSWELHHDKAVVDAETARQMTGELQRILFWIHHASGPIGVGILTLAAASALFGYFAAALTWRFWSSNRWRNRRRRRA
jgi:uncharacterized protein (DUF2062 family)